jgi:hypothetical protein
MQDSISLLLGAGFSAPKGYPIGNKLNELLLGSENDNFTFHTTGCLVVNQDGSKPDFGYKTSYDIEYAFTMELMRYFKRLNNYFDYEEFYDFIHSEISNVKDVVELASKFRSGGNDDVQHLLNSVDNILVQLIQFYLHDEFGKSNYDGEPYISGQTYFGYSGFMRCLKALSVNSEVHIHTLNHDLFFERFNNTDFLEGRLCDGFTELGSPYLGKLEIRSRKYMCKLQYYSGEYEKQFKLYKLHGSLDYVLYHSGGTGLLTTECYLKIRSGIGFSDVYKEKLDRNGKYYYENSWVKNHSDFLTGTSSKIERYAEPLLYNKLFQHFKDNLKISKMLIIAGYGAKDTEINKILETNFDFIKKPVFIIDPYPNSNIFRLQKSLNAKLVEKQLQDISLSDLK